MTKNPLPRYTICNIITKDVTLIEKSAMIRLSGVTHEEIYRRGLEVIAQENLTQNNIS